MSEAAKPRRPSPLTLTAAALAGPLHGIGTAVIAVLLSILGVIKLLPAGAVGAPAGTAQPPAVDLLILATGGVLTASWGILLVGILQLGLGLGLLIPRTRGIAGLGCLVAAVLVAIGFVVHWGTLSTDTGLNPAGTALLMLIVILLAGAAAGCRAAARQVGVST